MIIKCPACDAQATLPESKEGAKVRCPQCSRVFVARPAGAGGARASGRGSRGRSADPTRFVLIGGALIVVAALFYIYRTKQGPQVVLRPEEPDTVAAASASVDLTGWDSELVLLTRRVHELLFAGDTAALRPWLHAERAYEWNGAPLQEIPADSLAAEQVSLPAPEESSPREPWASLSHDDQTLAAAERVEALAADEFLQDWVPYACAGDNGNGVLEKNAQQAVVRLVVKNRADVSLPDRFVEWRLAPEGDVWKVVHGARWFTESDLRVRHAKQGPPVEKVTLSDGSLVVEGQVRPLPHMEGIPPEEQEHIDGLVAKLVDLSLPAKELTAVRNELEAIGKPAIPPLLTQLATIPLETDDQAIQLNLVCGVLYSITGYVTTFKPHEALGAGSERRESGLKQWFGWYDRRFSRFEGKKEVAADLAPVSEEEQQALEEARRRKELAEKIGLDPDEDG